MLTTNSVGVVEYRIVEPGLIHATYTSTFALDKGLKQVMTGEARGDTANGFPGKYNVRYKGFDGEINGDFDWEIVEDGDILRLYWRSRKGAPPFVDGEGGLLVHEGFGFRNSENSIVVTYWVTPEFLESRRKSAGS